MVKWALITGASCGIGLEFAKIHASRGGNLILVARREDVLEQVKLQIESQYSCIVHIIVSDLSKLEAASAIYSQVMNWGIEIDFLINNAGAGAHGNFCEIPLEKSLELVNLNISSLVALTHLFLARMIKRNEGKILNVASMAGFIPGPLHSIYYATKSFVISFSQALANELKNKNVKISVLCPGPTQTEFFARANMQGARTLKRGAVSAKSVAIIGYEGMLKDKILVIPGFMNKVFLLGLRFIPRRLIVNASRYLMEKPSH